MALAISSLCSLSCLSGGGSERPATPSDAYRVNRDVIIEFGDPKAIDRFELGFRAPKLHENTADGGFDVDLNNLVSVTAHRSQVNALAVTRAGLHAFSGSDDGM